MPGYIMHEDPLSKVRMFGYWQCPICDRLCRSVGAFSFYLQTMKLEEEEEVWTIACRVKTCEDCNTTPLHFESLDQRIAAMKHLRKTTEKKNVLCLFKMLESF